MNLQLDNKDSSRRAFLKMSGGCAALGSTAFMSQMLNLQLTNAAVAQDLEHIGSNNIRLQSDCLRILVRRLRFLQRPSSL